MQHLKFFIAIAVALGCIAAASPARADVPLTGALVGSGPYYLDRSGETYILTEDLITPGTALVFAADDVTLDLNGHTVTFGVSTLPYRYGIVIPPTYRHSSDRWSRSDLTVWKRAHNARIQNGTIVQGAGQADSCAAVISYGGVGITVSGTDVRIFGDDTHAMHFDECRDLRVHGNTITDSTHVITNRHQGRAAIDVSQAGEGFLEIFDNTIHNCRQWGIRVTRREAATVGRIFDNKIYPNTIVTNGYGIGAHGDNLDVYGNQIIASNGRGIQIDEASHVLVHDNVIDVIELPVSGEYDRLAAHGIKLERCRNSEIYRNHVTSKGLAKAWDSTSMGMALCFEVGAHSNNYIHDNTLIARHLGGDVLDRDTWFHYATAIEGLYATAPSGLRVERNTLISNDAFITLSEWHATATETVQPSDAMDIVWRDNHFMKEATPLAVKGKDLRIWNSSFRGLRLTDSDGVDLRSIWAGWPWQPCSWEVAYTGAVQALGKGVRPIPGLLVVIRDRTGTVVAEGVTDAQGRVSAELVAYTVSIEGDGVPPRFEDRNPHDITLAVGGRSLTRRVTVDATSFLVVVDADTSSSRRAPTSVGEIRPVFEVAATSPPVTSQNVSTTTDIHWFFSEAVQASSLDAGVISVEGSLSGTHEGSSSLSSDGRRLSFQPASPFIGGEIVTARLAGTLRSEGGLFLDGNGDGTAGDEHVLIFVVTGAALKKPEEKQPDTDWGDRN